MIRSLSTLSAAALLTAGLAAQCGSFASPGTLIGTGDDTVFGHNPLGFAFTMAGSAGSTTWTHFQASTNGWLVLTDGVASSGIPTGTSYGSVAASSASSLYGPAGSNPRIAPYWGDLNITVANTAGVYFDNTTNPGVSCTVTWINAVDYVASGGIKKSFQAEIFADGHVTFSYTSGMNYNTGSSKYVGISAANGTAVQTAVNLVPGPSATVGGGMHQVFSTAGSLDTGGTTLSFVPAGAGWTESVVCQVFAASHANYGSGCYTLSDSFYQLFADAAAAGPALSTNSMVLTPSGAQYSVAWGGGSFLAPIAPVNAFAAATDDGEVVVTPSIAFPSPTGPQASVRLHSNGLVSWGAAAQTFPGTNNFTPTAGGFLGAGNAGVWSWHDYNESELGSGRIKREEMLVGADTVLCFTWDAVENYAGPEVVNPSTMQIQLNLSNGKVTFVWVSIDANNTSPFGSAHLVGYSPAGASNNAGSLNLATALPLTTQPLNAPAMSMSAAPAPVSTAGSGTLVTYTLNDIPLACPAPAPVFHFGIVMLSVGQDLPGTDLLTGYGLDAPGCALHITSLDVALTYIGATPSQTVDFQVAAGVPYGLQFYAQAAALVCPNTLPNGLNNAGIVVSNGVASFVSSF